MVHANAPLVSEAFLRDCDWSAQYGFFKTPAPDPRLQLIETEVLLFLRIGLRGDCSDASRRHAERVEELPQGARTVREPSQLLYLGGRLVERRGRMLAEMGLKWKAMALQRACRGVEVELGEFLDPACLEQFEVLLKVREARSESTWKKRSLCL